MFESIKNLFGKKSEGTPDDQPDANNVPLAAAVMLMEAALMDNKLEDTEQKTILKIMATKFECTPAAAHELLQEAEAQLADKDHFYRYTKVLKDNLDEDGRLQVIEMLWEVIYADGDVDDYEANLMRRICGLLFVTDRQSGDIRKKVKAKTEADRNRLYTDEDFS